MESFVEHIESPTGEMERMLGLLIVIVGGGEGVTKQNKSLLSDFFRFLIFIGISFHNSRCRRIYFLFFIRYLANDIFD